jgi:hypothetical protein
LRASKTIKSRWQPTGLQSSGGQAGQSRQGARVIEDSRRTRVASRWPDKGREGGC